MRGIDAEDACGAHLPSDADRASSTPQSPDNLDRHHAIEPVGLGIRDLDTQGIRGQGLVMQNLRPAALADAPETAIFGTANQELLANYCSLLRALSRRMSKITSYRDLIVWQKAMDLVELVYRITAKFPKSEQFGLMRQMRNAAVSVPSNISEGHRLRTPGYISRVYIALGEHAELETEMLISDRVGYVKPNDMAAFTALSTQVGELAHGLLRSLESQ